MLRIRVYWLSGDRPKTEFHSVETWEVDTENNHLIIFQDGAVSYVERQNIRFFLVDTILDEETS